MTVEQTRLANLRRLIEEMGSAAAVARAASTPAAYISQIVTRKSSRTGKARDVGTKLARRLEAGCGKPEGWLDRSHAATVGVPSRAAVGTPTVTSSTNDSLVMSGPATRPGHAHAMSLGSGEMWLPLHPNVHPAMPSQPDPGAVVNLIRVNTAGLKGLLGATPVTSLDALRVCTQPDDSMSATFPRGSMLLLDTGVGFPDHDGIYLLSGNDDVMVRRLQRRLDGAWSLLPDNDRYQAEIVPRDRKSDYRVLGRVVYAWCGLPL